MMWHPAPATAPGIPPEYVTSRVRITRTDGTVLVLSRASLREDAITGIEEGGGSTSVATADIQELEAWRVDPGFMLLPAFVVAVVVLPKVLTGSLHSSSGTSIVDGP